MNDKKEFVAYLQKKYKDLSEEKLKQLQESGQLEKDYKEFQKSKKQKLLHGAKLSYIKSLKNQCAEDEELYYYKKGGVVGCGCKKKEDGGKVIESAQNGAVAKFKSRPTKWTDKDERKLDSLSTREAKKQPLTPQGKKDLKNLRDKFKKSSNKKDYELEEGKKGMKVEKDCGGAVAKFKAKCGSKLKKHQQGGSLNGIPFMQAGTPKGGIKRFRYASSDNKTVREFNTREGAEQFRKSLGKPGKIIDQKGASYDSTLKTNTTSGKDARRTSYDRQQAEKPYNNLSQKEAYKKAQSSGKKYYAYRGKVYRTDLKNGIDNITEMEAMYGNNLGWDKDPKLQNKQSREARRIYRKKTKSVDNSRPVKPLETNSSVNEKADKYAKQTWDETKFVDMLMPTNVAANVALKFADKNNYHGDIYRSGLNPMGYAEDIQNGNVGGLATRALDATAYFGVPSQLVTKIAPKIPVPTYLQQVYHGDLGSTNWVIQGLNRASGKVKNFFTRLVPRKGNGLYGKYSIEAAEHLPAETTGVVTNGTRQYITSNPEAVQPLYTYFGNAANNPNTWRTLDITNQYANNNYKVGGKLKKHQQGGPLYGTYLLPK